MWKVVLEQKQHECFVKRHILVSKTTKVKRFLHIRNVLKNNLITHAENPFLYVCENMVK